jgi:hypothetical protein
MTPAERKARLAAVLRDQRERLDRDAARRGAILAQYSPVKIPPLIQFTQVRRRDDDGPPTIYSGRTRPAPDRAVANMLRLWGKARRIAKENPEDAPEARKMMARIEAKLKLEGFEVTERGDDTT